MTPHAYNPDCTCFRCSKIADGFDPEVVDSFLRGRQAQFFNDDYEAPPGKLYDPFTKEFYDPGKPRVIPAKRRSNADELKLCRRYYEQEPKTDRDKLPDNVIDLNTRRRKL